VTKRRQEFPCRTTSTLPVIGVRTTAGRESKYPPAEPGALKMGPLEAAVGVADVVRHKVTLFDPAFLLQRQPCEHLPRDSPSSP
jgi:hypothetical protein